MKRSRQRKQTFTGCCLLGFFFSLIGGFCDVEGGNWEPAPWSLSTHVGRFTAPIFVSRWIVIRPFPIPCFLTKLPSWFVSLCTVIKPFPIPCLDEALSGGVIWSSTSVDLEVCIKKIASLGHNYNRQYGWTIFTPTKQTTSTLCTFCLLSALCFSWQARWEITEPIEKK